MIISGRNTICGTYHEKCQDYSLSENFGDDIVLLAVADGVGSAAYSEIGSEKACIVVAKYIREHIGLVKDSYISGELGKNASIRASIIEMLNQAYNQAITTIRQIAKEQERSLGDYATTLSVVLYTPEYTFWGHSGDGGIFAIREDGTIEMISTEQSGMLAGEVYPLDSDREYWSFGIEKSDMAYMLMTDGVLSYIKAVAVGEYCHEYFEQILKGVLQRTEIDDFIKVVINSNDMGKYTSDDKTLGIILNKDKYVENNSNIQFEYMQNEIYKSKIVDKWFYVDAETFFRQNLKNGYSILPDGYNYIVVGKENDKEVLFRAVTPRKMLVEQYENNRLYSMHNIVKNILGIIWYLWENRGKIEINYSNDLSDDLAGRIYYASNIENTTLKVYEYNDFIVSDIKLNKDYLEKGINISYITTSYMYQLGYVLYKTIRIGKHNDVIKNVIDIDVKDEQLYDTITLLEVLKKKNELAQEEAISKDKKVISEEIKKDNISKLQENSDIKEDNKNDEKNNEPVKFKDVVSDNFEKKEESKFEIVNYKNNQPNNVATYVSIGINILVLICIIIMSLKILQLETEVQTLMNSDEVVDDNNKLEQVVDLKNDEQTSNEITIEESAKDVENVNYVTEEIDTKEEVSEILTESQVNEQTSNEVATEESAEDVNNVSEEIAKKEEALEISTERQVNEQTSNKVVTEESAEDVENVNNVSEEVAKKEEVSEISTESQINEQIINEITTEESVEDLENINNVTEEISSR